MAPLRAKAGHQQGFNPYRDGRGRYAEPGGDGVRDTSTHFRHIKNDRVEEHKQHNAKINTAIRRAAGRATADAGGTFVNDRVLSQVDSIRAPLAAQLTPATRRALRAIDPDAETRLQRYGVRATLERPLLGQLERGANPANTTVLEKALAELGYRAPAGARPSDLLAMVEAIRTAPTPRAAEGRSLYGASMALRAKRPDLAAGMLTGPGSLQGDDIYARLQREVHNGAAP